MIVVMKPQAQKEQIDSVCDTIRSRGLDCHVSIGSHTTIIGVIGDKAKLIDVQLTAFPGVRELIPVSEPYKLAGRTGHPENTVIDIGDTQVGAKELMIAAGPCAVEDYETMRETALALRTKNIKFLRGGAYKPRTSPYSFQGLEEEGLKILARVAEETGMKVVTEAIDDDSIERVAYYADVVQIGARNMQNFHLLRKAGQCGKPVVLKRGLSSTIDEWLNAAEYIMSSGNANVILCERGIRTFETATRNTLDISAVPVLKAKTHLPIIVDPSHAAGARAYIESLSMCAIAAGADGLIVEVHPRPDCAKSDAAQTIGVNPFLELCKKISELAKLMNRTMPGDENE